MKVCVTGGEGFLGTHVVRKLQNLGHDVKVPSHHWFDLRDRFRVRSMFEDIKPEVVIHAAALCGGIYSNSQRPAEYLYDNLIMGMHMLDAAKDYGVNKFVEISSVCAYPLDVEIPIKEDSLWYGYPEPTNAPYGLAKRLLVAQAQAYSKQYGLNVISLIPVNMYGPGDKFDLEVSHVIPSLIRKCLENREELVVWGTGNASREFLYVEDCAEAIVKAVEKYNRPEPANIGTGQETTIHELVREVIRATGFKGTVLWDTTKPEGQPRRLFDVSRAEREFGFKAKTELREGIEKTVRWYKECLSRQ